MAKQDLVVVLAAGASIPAGLPSTKEITDSVMRWDAPAAQLNAIPYVVPPSTKPQAFARVVPVVPAIEAALRGVYESVDFERILHALEQLELFVSSRAVGAIHDDYRPVLTAFAGLDRRYAAVLEDANLIRDTRQWMIRHVFNYVGMRADRSGRRDHIAARQSLEVLFTALARRFRLVVINLNYDDVIDTMPLPWFDGFVRPVESWSACKLFDVHRWLSEERRAREHFLIHLHGSIRFGYAPNESTLQLSQFSEPAHYDSYLQAAGTLEHRWSSSTLADGGVHDAFPIISGAQKAAKMIFNARPYGYYYRAAMTALIDSPRMLAIGYGGRDVHLNAWIEEHVRVHGDARKAVIINRIPGSEVGEETPLNKLLRELAGVKGWSSGHWRAYEGAEEDVQTLGPLMLLPRGIPLKKRHVADVVRHFAARKT
jgi:hypothetical protein